MSQEYGVHDRQISSYVLMIYCVQDIVLRKQ